MKDIKRILLATDFSSISKKALETTVYLKENLGCSVDVIHVFDATAFEMPAPYYFMPGVEHWVDEHFTGMRDKGRTALDDLIPELGEDAHAHFLEGKPGKTIVHFAEDNGIDLIIMGTHGHRGLEHLVLGSVAEYVVRHAGCAVLTIKGDPKDKH